MAMDPSEGKFKNRWMGRSGGGAGDGADAGTGGVAAPADDGKADGDGKQGGKFTHVHVLAHHAGHGKTHMISQHGEHGGGHKTMDHGIMSHEEAGAKLTQIMHSHDKGEEPSDGEMDSGGNQ